MRTVVSAGGLGTNWGLALARHAAERGIATELALVEQPRTPEVQERLEQLQAAARVHLTHDNRRTALALPRIMGRAAVRDRAAPAWLPPGGSSPLGTLGYVHAGLELGAQVEAGELPEPGPGGHRGGIGRHRGGPGPRAAAGGPAHPGDGRGGGRPAAPGRPRALAQGARRGGAAAKQGVVHPVPDVREDDLDVTFAQLGPGYGHATEASERAARGAGGARPRLQRQGVGGARGPRR